MEVVEFDYNLFSQ